MSVVCIIQGFLQYEENIVISALSITFSVLNFMKVKNTWPLGLFLVGGTYLNKEKLFELLHRDNIVYYKKGPVGSV